MCKYYGVVDGRGKHPKSAIESTSWKAYVLKFTSEFEFLYDSMFISIQDTIVQTKGTSFKESNRSLAKHQPFGGLAGKICCVMC